MSDHTSTLRALLRRSKVHGASVKVHGASVIAIMTTDASVIIPPCALAVLKPNALALFGRVGLKRSGGAWRVVSCYYKDRKGTCATD